MRECKTRTRDGRIKCRYANEMDVTLLSIKYMTLRYEAEWCNGVRFGVALLTLLFFVYLTTLLLVVEVPTQQKLSSFDITGDSADCRNDDCDDDDDDDDMAFFMRLRCCCYFNFCCYYRVFIFSLQFVPYQLYFSCNVKL